MRLLNTIPYDLLSNIQRDWELTTFLLFIVSTSLYCHRLTEAGMDLNIYIYFKIIIRHTPSWNMEREREIYTWK